MRISEFCFKSFGTCVVIVVALSIAGWIAFPDIWGLVATIGITGGIALAIGIIAMIWEGTQ